MDEYKVMRWFKDKSRGSSIICSNNEDFIVDCQTNSQAELVCKLLNENEARKNQPRINKETKIDKYTVVEVTDPSEWDGYLIKQYEIHFEGKEIHTIQNKKSAELFCKLLNENEARKNQPRIDVDIKQSIINSLIAKRELRYKTKFTTVTKDIDIQIIDEAIEIISSLPSEK